VDPLAEKYYPISPYAYVANNPLVYIDPDGMRLDWVHDNENDEYVWMDNVNSAESTPEGYRYVGPNDNDILKDLNLPYSYESAKITTIGMGLDGEKGKGAAPTAADADISINISAKADVSYNPEQGSENNKLGRKFEGVSFTARMSYSTRGSSPDLSLDYGGQFYVQTRNTTYRNTMTSSNSNTLSEGGSVSLSAVVSIPSSQINRQNPFNRAIVTAGAPNSKLILNPRPIRNEWNLSRNHLYLQD